MAACRAVALLDPRPGRRWARISNAWEIAEECGGARWCVSGGGGAEIKVTCNIHRTHTEPKVVPMLAHLPSKTSTSNLVPEAMEQSKNLSNFVYRNDQEGLHTFASS